MIEFWNANGLKNGIIPAGRPCPWISSCAKKTKECPKETRPHLDGYSCDQSRLFSIRSGTDKDLKRIDPLDSLKAIGGVEPR